MSAEANNLQKSIKTTPIAPVIAPVVLAVMVAMHNEQ